MSVRPFATVIAALFTATIVSSASARPAICSVFDQAMDPKESSVGKSVYVNGCGPENPACLSIFTTSVKVIGTNGCQMSRFGDKRNEVFCSKEGVAAAAADRWLDILAVTVSLCYPGSAVTRETTVGEGEASSSYSIRFDLPGAELPRSVVLYRLDNQSTGYSFMSYSFRYNRG